MDFLEVLTHSPNMDYRDTPLDGQRSDEETPLLAGSSSSSASPMGRRRRRPTPLPRFQIGILLLFQMAEPMSSHVIYPFINQLIFELDITHGDRRKVGYYAGLIESIFFAVEAVTIMFWGRLSDRIGRKPVLLVGLAGVGTSLILFGLSRTFWTLVASRCLCGLLNGNVGVIKSMVGEMTDSSNMAQAFALMPVAWAIGGTLAPLIGGGLSRPQDHWPNVFRSSFWQQYPYFLPCFVAACFCGFCFFLALAFLKETVVKSPKAAPHSKKVVSYPEDLTHEHSDSSGRTSPTSTIVGHSHTDSEGTVVNDDTDVDASFKAILTPRVLLAIAAYAALAILDIAFGALQPLVLATPIEYGGLGVSPTTIGIVLGSFGVLNGVLQGVMFTRVLQLFGLRRTFIFAMAAFVTLFAMFPLLNMAARAEGRAGPLMWTLVSVQLLNWVVMDMSYACVFMYITSAAPHKRCLGSVNGLGQVTASVMRAIGPAASTSLFAVSQTRGLLGGNLVYVVMVLLSLGGVTVVWQLPPEAWDMNDCHDEDE